MLKEILYILGYELTPINHDGRTEPLPPYIPLFPKWPRLSQPANIDEETQDTPPTSTNWSPATNTVDPPRNIPRPPGDEPYFETTSINEPPKADIKPTSIIMSTPRKLQIKVDVTHYPTFDGKDTSWKKFYARFVAIAAGHKLCLPMPHKVGADEKLKAFKFLENERYQDENSFLFSAIQNSCANAPGACNSRIQKYEEEMDGYGALKSLYQWYESQGSVEDLRRRLMTKLLNLQLKHDTRGWADSYIGIFEEIIIDLDKTGTLSDVDKKNFFLNGIVDTTFDLTKDVCRNEPTITYDECVTRIRRMAVMNHQEHLRKVEGRRKINNFHKSQHRYWLPRAQWARLSPQERQEFLNKRNSQNGPRRNQHPTRPKEKPSH